MKRSVDLLSVANAISAFDAACTIVDETRPNNGYNISVTYGKTDCKYAWLLVSPHLDGFIYQYSFSRDVFEFTFDHISHLSADDLAQFATLMTMEGLMSHFQPRRKITVSTVIELVESDRVSIRTFRPLVRFIEGLVDLYVIQQVHNS